MGVVTSASERAHSFRAKSYMTEDSLGLVLLQHGSFFDDHISISQSVVFVNQSSVIQFFFFFLSSIGPKLINAALD